MSKFLSYFFLLLIMSFFVMTVVNGDDGKLFDKVFGHTSNKEIVDLPVFHNKRQIGEVGATVVETRKILSFLKKDLLEIFHREFNQRFYRRFKSLMEDQEQISLEFLNNQNIMVDFDYVQLRLFFSFPVEYVKTSTTWLSDNSSGKADALMSEKISGRLNYSFQEEIFYKGAKKSNLKGDFDSVINVYDFVLENDFQYAGKDKFIRNRSVLVKDFSGNALRCSVGDITPSTFSYQTYMSMGGISLAREYDIWPYKVITPLNDHQFILKEKSTVEIYVNGVLVRSLILPVGKHAIRDIPINDGVNEVKLVIFDSKGKKNIVNLTKSTSTELLRQGLSEFSYAVGVKNHERESGVSYDTLHNVPRFSLFHRWGLRSNLTLGAFLQGDDQQFVGGGKAIFATGIGNFSVDGAYSSILDTVSGAIGRITYSLTSYSNSIWHNRRYYLGVEHTSVNYASMGVFSPYNRTINRIFSSLNQSLSRQLSITVGGSYSQQRHSQSNVYGGNLAINKRWTSDINSSLYVGRDKIDRHSWNDYAYLFINIILPEENQHITTFVDSLNKSERIDWRYHGDGRRHNVNTNLAMGRNDRTQTGSGGFEYLHPKFNFKFNQDITKISKKEERTTEGVSSFEASGSLLFAGNSFAISRPVFESFAIIKADESFNKQKIGVNSHSLALEDEVNLFGPGVISNLRPYHYEMVSLNPIDLPPGHYLKQENFKLFPTNKSGHLLLIGNEAKILLITTLVDKTGAPLSLQTGEFVSSDGRIVRPFFTNRVGRVVVEGLVPGQYRVLLDDFAMKRNGRMMLPTGIAGIHKIARIIME